MALSILAKYCRQNANYKDHIVGKVNKGRISRCSIEKMLNRVISDTFHRHLNVYQN